MHVGEYVRISTLAIYSQRVFLQRLFPLQKQRCAAAATFSTFLHQFRIEISLLMKTPTLFPAAAACD